MRVHKPTTTEKKKRKSSRRVPYVPISCEVCGVVREYPPGEVRQRGKIRFCSRKCMGVATDKKVSVVCGTCGLVFKKNRHRIFPAAGNYCSQQCAHRAKIVDGAKWRDQEQIAAYMREYTQKNRDRHNELSRKWAKRNRDKRNHNQRMRRANGSGRRAKVRAAMIELYGDACLMCGTTESIEVDHIVPVSMGGLLVIENVQPLCRSCNSSKGAKCIDFRERN